MFSMDHPLMKALTKIGNFFLVSFFWLLCCIPVVTILPSCAALHDTIFKVVRGDGNGVASAFFTSFRQALRPGVLLSVFAVAGSLLLYTCVDFGQQMMQGNVLWAGYFAVGCFLCCVWAAALLWIPSVLARFDARARDVVRIALYLSVHCLPRTVLMVLLLAVMYFMVEIYPVLLLLLPALYADLLCGGTEKALGRVMKLTGMERGDSASSADEDGNNNTEREEFSALKQAREMEEKGRKP